MDAPTPEVQPTPADTEPRSTPDAGKRERKPPSEAQAKRAAAAKRLKRRMEQLLADGDPATLEAAASALDGKASATAAGAEPAPQADKPAALEKPAAPGPTAEEVAAFAPMAAGLMAMVAEPLAGTAYDPMRPRPNPLGGDPIVPAKAISEALAPVLAKHLPAMLTTPEGNLALALGLWLLPPTVELAKARLMAGAESAAAGVQAG